MRKVTVKISEDLANFLCEHYHTDDISEAIKEIICHALADLFFHTQPEKDIKVLKEG